MELQNGINGFPLKLNDRLRLVVIFAEKDMDDSQLSIPSNAPNKGLE